MRAQDWVLLILLSILWGGSFFFVAVALRELPPLTLVLARVVTAAAALAPVVLLMGYAFPRSAAHWRDFAVMAVLNNIIPSSLIFWGQTLIPAGLASILNATTPLMTLLVAAAVAGEAIGRRKLAGVLLGVAGVAVLAGPEAIGAASGTSLAGMLAVLGGALSYGFSGLWGRRLKAFAAPVSAASQLACSSILLAPIAAAADRFWLLPMPSQSTVLAVLALALLSTALAYILFFRIMQAAGPLNVMLVTLLIPFTGVALGALFLGEALTLRQVAGGLVIALSLLVIDGRLFGVRAEAPATGRGEAQRQSAR